MSRVGQKPIDIPAGVEVETKDGRVTAGGPLGRLELALPVGITVRREADRLFVERANDSRERRALHGTIRSLLANMVVGVKDGFRRELEIQGVGYRAQLQGRKLVMSLGFSHPVEYEVPEGVNVEVKDGTAIILHGADKQQVGLAAARIRKFSPADPYKGKGIRYKGEHVRRKAGKTVA